MEKTRIFIAGDSIAAVKQPDKRPETGWGEKLGLFFTDEVEVVDCAVNGCSTKSFIDEGRLDRIAAQMAPGDFLLIQFGHNDEKDAPGRHTDPATTYPANLTRFVETARHVKATPILLTPVQRRSFDSHGKIENTHGEYPDAMKRLAARLRVPCIDMTAVSTRYLEHIGPEKAEDIFLWVRPGYPNYPQGKQDNTHFCDNGAFQMARLIAGELQNLHIPALERRMRPAD